MDLKELKIKGLYLLTPKVFRDKRGFFFEAFRRTVLEDEGMNADFVQDNVSSSVKGTLRGLHYQIHQPQAKLIQCLQGKIIDVAVDLRRSSPDFGKHVSVDLSDDNKQLFYIPEGFAHGFSVLSESALISYKCTDYYSPEGERGVRWNDPALEIEWQVENPVLSDKDKGLPLLKELKETDLFS